MIDEVSETIDELKNGKERGDDRISTNSSKWVRGL